MVHVCGYVMPHCLESYQFWDSAIIFPSLNTSLHVKYQILCSEVNFLSLKQYFTLIFTTKYYIPY